MLPGSAGIAIPAVVAHIHQYLRTKTHELPYLIGENGLVANKDAVPVTVETKDLSLISARELRDATCEFTRKEKNIPERHIFAEWDKVNLVVAPHAGPVAADNQS